MWEGPYIITEVVGQGAYRLQEQSGTMVPRSRNVVHLKLLPFLNKYIYICILLFFVLQNKESPLQQYSTKILGTNAETTRC